MYPLYVKSSPSACEGALIQQQFDLFVIWHKEKSALLHAASCYACFIFPGVSLSTQFLPITWETTFNKLYNQQLPFYTTLGPSTRNPPLLNVLVFSSNKLFANSTLLLLLPFLHLFLSIFFFLTFNNFYETLLNFFFSTFSIGVSETALKK